MLYGLEQGRGGMEGSGKSHHLLMGGSVKNWWLCLTYHRWEDWDPEEGCDWSKISGQGLSLPTSFLGGSLHTRTAPSGKEGRNVHPGKMEAPPKPRVKEISHIPSHLKSHLVAFRQVSEETEPYFHCHENKDWETDPVAHKKQRKDGGGQKFWYPCFRMPTEKWLDSKGSWTHLKASSGLLWTASGKHKPSHRSSWTPVFDLFTREWSILGLPELGGEDKPSE